ncbi:MAG: hypothetical protein CL747_08570 [Chloroflexi bacterium]|nr:hypothetical protein [Chloroflexota bacterium]
MALDGVTALLIWIRATSDDEDAGETYQPVLTESIASSLAFASLLSSGETVSTCRLESSVLPGEAEVVYASSKTWLVTLGTCTFIVDDATRAVSRP